MSLWWWGISIGVLLCVWLLSADRPSWEDDLERIKTSYGRAFKKHCFFAKVGWYRRSQQRLWHASQVLFPLLAFFVLLMRVQGRLTWSWLMTVYVIGILAAMPFMIWRVRRLLYVKRLRLSWLMCVRFFFVFFVLGFPMEQIIVYLYPMIRIYYPVLREPLYFLRAEILMTADAHFAWERFRQRLDLPQELQVTYMIEDSLFMGAGSFQALENSLQNQTDLCLEAVSSTQNGKMMLLLISFLLLFVAMLFLVGILITVPLFVKGGESGEYAGLLNMVRGLLGG